MLFKIQTCREKNGLKFDSRGIFFFTPNCLLRPITVVYRSGMFPFQDSNITREHEEREEWFDSREIIFFKF